MTVQTTLVLAVAIFTPASFAGAISVDLGTADSFAFLAGSTLTNTGSSVIHGNLGLQPGSSIIGFPPGIVTAGIVDDANAVAIQARTDLITAYNAAAREPCANTLTGQDLGGLTLTPGVYCFADAAQLTGTLTLNALGDPNSVFLFQIGSTLTTASASSVVFINAGEGDSVFWQVGSSATLGTSTAFTGNILALTSITLGTTASITCGRALARNGAGTLDTNVVSIDTQGSEASGGSSIPEPGTAALLAAAMLAAAMFASITAYWRRKRAA